MRIWKFILLNDRFYPMPDGSGSYRGCLAIAVAETEAAAREILVADAAKTSIDMRWLEIALVFSIPVAPGVVAIVME